MIIHQGNAFCTVVSATAQEQRWVYKYLSFPDEKAKFRRAPVWKRDSDVHMMNELNSSFPAGFLGAVQKAAKAASVSVQVVNKRVVPCKPDVHGLTDWLRDYQLEAIDAGLANERGVFHQITGSGKTEIIVALAGEKLQCKWLILTHRKDLVAQIVDRFARRTGEQVGTWYEGKFKPARITVAMFQSVYAGRRKPDTAKFLDSIQGVMIDECHVVPANTLYSIVMSLKNAYFRYGFSGTPFARGDRKSIYLWGAVGPVIHRIAADRLIAAGVLARPKIQMIKVVHPPLDVKMWNEAYAQGITGSVVRNAAVVRAAKKSTKPCLLFVKELSHGKTIERALVAAGVKTEFVWGNAHVAVRQAAVRRLVHGDTDVLVCTVIFQEGIDIPELQSVVFASAGKSVIATLQSLGRGTRRHSTDGKETKAEFDVYDFMDQGCGCKAPNKHRGCKWLEKHMRTRRRAYASERFEVIQK